MRHSQTQIFVAGFSEFGIGASQQNAKVTSFEPIQFENPEDARNIKRMQCCKSMGLTFIIMATYDRELI